MATRAPDQDPVDSWADRVATCGQCEVAPDDGVLDLCPKHQFEYRRLADVLQGRPP